MKHVAIEQVLERAERAQSDSDFTYFFSLLLAAEALAKTIVLGIVAAIAEDNDRNRYRLEHQLARSDGLGEWGKALEDAMTYCALRLLFYLTGAVKFTAILLVALLVSVPAILAQDATATPTPTPDLLSAQFKNQTAQADYYSQQAHPNFWNSLPAIGASLAAVVAFVSLLFNLWMTQHNQHNTQFYEALKRFGDKDSLQTRSIAATLLVEITMNHSRFLDNTIDALSIGLLTDTNDVALDSYKTALSQIVRRKPQKCLPKLASTNRKLRHSLAKTLAEYLLVNEERGTPEKGIDAHTWETVEQLTQYGRAQLEKLFSDNGIGTLANELAEAKTRLGVNSKATIRDDLQVAAKRLRLIEQLLQEASQAKPRRWRSWQSIELPLEMK